MTSERSIPVLTLCLSLYSLLKVAQSSETSKMFVNDDHRGRFHGAQLGTNILLERREEEGGGW